MADAAAIDEVLRMHAAREAQMIARTGKALGALLVIIAIGYLPIHSNALIIFRAIGILGFFAVGFGIAVGTLLRRWSASKFVSILRSSPEAVVRIYTNVNVSGAVRSGTAVVIETLDNRNGSAPFLDADINRAVALLKQACPNAK